MLGAVAGGGRGRGGGSALHAARGKGSAVPCVRRTPEAGGFVPIVARAPLCVKQPLKLL